MSNRKKAFSTPSKNPAKKFIEWKSNEKLFSYYDKEQATNVQIQLPFKFLVLDELHTIKGWNDQSQSAIFANEVKFISKEDLRVKSFKGGNIATGIYKEIKNQILSAGGHYVKSIYVMLEDGSIANISFKGSCVKQWSDFTQKTRSRIPDEWVVVDSCIEEKKGSVKYTVPLFKFEKSLTNSESDIADAAYNELEAYLKTYLIKETEEEQIEDEQIEEELAF